MRKTSLLAFLLCLPAVAANLTTTQAQINIGKTAKVCGTVSGIHYADKKGQQTYINLDGAHAYQAFMIVISENNRSAFGTLEQFAHGRICAKGKITSYRGTPEIVVDAPSDLFRP